MSRTLEPAELTKRAVADAKSAAARAGVQIEPVEQMPEIDDVCALFAELWATDTRDQLPTDLLRALTHAGNYAAAAFADGVLVGGVVGFLGHEHNEYYLHSHILGVSPAHRGGNVGYALKLHQRAWALAQGLRKIKWTFDPLVRRNAYFNFQKLGASTTTYYESFYGAMRDGVNAGDESDRLLITWDLLSPRVELASSDSLHAPDVDSLVSSGATVALDEAGSVTERVTTPPVVVCATPDDIVALRRHDAPAASAWRGALRSTLGAALSDGYRVSGFSRSGWYVLNRGGESHAGS